MEQSATVLPAAVAECRAAPGVVRRDRHPGDGSPARPASFRRGPAAPRQRRRTRTHSQRTPPTQTAASPASPISPKSPLKACALSSSRPSPKLQRHSRSARSGSGPPPVPRPSPRRCTSSAARDASSAFPRGDTASPLPGPSMAGAAGRRYRKPLPPRTPREAGVESRTGAPALGSGAYSVAFAPGLSPAPMTAFPVPAHQTVRAIFSHTAFGRDHAFALGRPIAVRVRRMRLYSSCSLSSGKRTNVPNFTLCFRQSHRRSR